MSPPRRPQDQAQLLLDSGLVDADYVAAQLGTTFESVEQAVEAVLAAGDLAPHPLFEPAWLPRRKPWLRAGLHPVAWYVAERRRRNRMAPHPLVDPRVVYDLFPDARLHEHGALSYWVSVAQPGTPLPTKALVEPVTWGDYRSAAIDVARSWRKATSRRRPRLAHPSAAHRSEAHPSKAPPTDEAPDVTVVMPVQDRSRQVRASVESLQAQTHDRWTLVVVDRGSVDDSAAVITGLAAFDDRITLLREGRDTPGRCLNAGLEHAPGHLVTFLDPGRTWEPGHLDRLVRHLAAADLPLVHVGNGPVARSRRELLAGRPVDLVTTLLRRDVVEDAGGFDETLGGAVGRDLLLRLSVEHPLTPIDAPVTRPTEHPHPAGEDWDSLVLERHLVDWDAVARAPHDDDLVTLVLPLGADPRRTVEWLTAPRPADMEVVAVGTRLRRSHHLLAATLAAVVPRGRFVSVAADVNANVAANVGVSHARGDTVVVASAEAASPRVPLAPLIAAVEQESVALAQPVVTGRDGLVVSAGAMFSPVHEHPSLFLAGHPVADAQRIGTFTVPAPASPVVAMRTSVAASLRGFDGRFRTAGAEIDLGLRADAAALGRCVVVPASWIALRGPYAEPTQLVSALRVLSRIGHSPACVDVEALLGRAGFEVTDARSVRIVADPIDPAGAVLVPGQVVRAVSGIHESPPRLRWAIDIAAPAAARGDRWGDSHFAASLAEALQRQGQDVAVDRRDARHRDTRDHDDVLLVLRGLDRVAPRPGLLNVEWVISHPDLVGPHEVAGFDLVYAASLSWADKVTREWGLRVAPLLQCTDPRRFNPDQGSPGTGPEVLFVGNSRGIYRFSVRSALAIGAPLTLHGSDWAEFVPYELIASDGVPNTGLGALYASAGVVLNDHHLDMRRDSFASNRLFDAAACGARVVSDPIEGLQEIFGGVVQPFRDERELRALVEPPYAAFPDDTTRREIAWGIVAEHSFDHRAEALVGDVVRRLREPRTSPAG